MKLKITKGDNFDKQTEDNKCLACNGSGYYDSYDFVRNRSIKCDACNGYGTKDGKPKSF